MYEPAPDASSCADFPPLLPGSECDEHGSVEIRLPDTADVDVHEATSAAADPDRLVPVHNRRKDAAVELGAEIPRGPQLDTAAGAHREAVGRNPASQYRVRPNVPARNGRTRPSPNSWIPPPCQ